MNTVKRSLALSAALILLAMLLCSCLGGSDDPPDDGTPEPPALNGTFSCGDSTMTFSGDGHSVRLSLSRELAGLTGLSEGDSVGTYVFIFRNESWRYDKAETFRLTVDGKEYRFMNAPDKTNEKTVAFYATSDDTRLLVFNKE